VKSPSTKIGEDSDIGVGTLLVEECNPSLVGVQNPTLVKARNLGYWRGYGDNQIIIMDRGVLVITASLR
jgi:hypothetical protein